MSNKFSFLNNFLIHLDKTNLSINFVVRKLKDIHFKINISEKKQWNTLMQPNNAKSNSYSQFHVFHVLVFLSDTQVLKGNVLGFYFTFISYVNTVVFL